MRKTLCIIGGMALVFTVAIIYIHDSKARYVRKQLEPDFFIPKSDKNKPEKLPMPVYLEGEEVTVKNARRGDVFVNEVDEPAEENRVQEVMALPKTSTQSPIKEEALEDTPKYQQKYNDYSNDIEQIGRTGTMPENPELQEDLEQMNSDERIPLF